MIGTVKAMIKRSVQSHSDWHEGLTSLRNTPIDDGLLSPARLLQGRTLRDNLPVSVEQYLVQGYDQELLREKLGDRKSRQKYYFDAHAGPEKAQLASGQNIMFRTAKGSWIPGTVQQMVSDRSYLVKSHDGYEFRRNRIDIRSSQVIPKEKSLVNSNTVSKTPDPPGLQYQIANPTNPGKDLIQTLTSVNAQPNQVDEDNASDNIHSEEVSDVAEARPRVSRSGWVLDRPLWHKDYDMSG